MKNKKIAFGDNSMRFSVVRKMFYTFLHHKIIYRSLIGIIVILFMPGVSFAGDSATISVSCTIPVIPGINAPPFPVKQDLKNVENTQEQTQEAKNKESKTQQKTETLFIAQELPGNTQLIYSR